MHSDGQHQAAAPILTARGYARDADLQQMRDLLMQARAQCGDWRYWHVGDFGWDFFMLTCRLNPHDHVRLWLRADGALVGYAILAEDPLFDCQVVPAQAWSGVETAALAWAERRLSMLRRDHPPRWGRALVARAHHDDACRIAFLEDHGFRRGKHVELHLLRLLAEPVPDPVLPSGWQVRAVTASETVARADIQHDVWQPWYVSQIVGVDYARLMHLPGYERDLDVVTIAPDGVIAAYAHGWIDPLNRIGVIGPVGARTAYRRQGLTRAALLEVLRRMRACDMNRVCISTGQTNTPALRLYESLGFRIVSESHDYAKPAEAGV